MEIRSINFHLSPNKLEILFLTLQPVSTIEYMQPKISFQEKTVKTNQTKYSHIVIVCLKVIDQAIQKKNAKAERVHNTCGCARGVVRGWAAVGQRLPPLTSLPAVHWCIQGRVSPSTHSCVLEVTRETFSTVALTGKNTK